MNISAVKGITGSNTFVLENNGSVIIIDAGARLRDVERVLGDRRPCGILLTHEHFDHIYHLADYRAAFADCAVYCHPAVCTEVGGGTALADGQVLNIGNFEIKAIFAPGHSAGSVVYLVSLRGAFCATKADKAISNGPTKQVQLFAGDVLFRGTIGRTDLMPNGEQLMQLSLRKLQTIKFENSHHGHGKDCTFAEQAENIRRFVE